MQQIEATVHELKAMHRGNGRRISTRAVSTQFQVGDRVRLRTKEMSMPPTLATCAHAWMAPSLARTSSMPKPSRCRIACAAPGPDGPWKSHRKVMRRAILAPGLQWDRRTRLRPGAGGQTRVGAATQPGGRRRWLSRQASSLLKKRVALDEKA